VPTILGGGGLKLECDREENKKPPFLAVFCLFMVPMIGIELTTFALRMRCSTN
jgi:hypothetical protein